MADLSYWFGEPIYITRQRAENLRQKKKHALTCAKNRSKRKRKRK